MNKDKHHWQGEVADTENHLGFIYVIECLVDGTKYVGKKQYWMAKPKAVGCKSKVTDKSNPRWKEACWKEGDWRNYTGSSKDFNTHIQKHGKHNFTFTILSQHTGKGSLHYAEVEEQVFRDVLRAKLPSGEFEYFNRQIAAVKFRPPSQQSEGTKRKISEAQSGEKNHWYGKTASPETKAKMSEAHSGDKNHMYGKPHTNSSKRKISESKKGVPMPEGQKKAQSKRMKGEGNPSYSHIIYIFEHTNGDFFQGTQYEFCSRFNLHSGNVSMVIRGKRATVSGWKCLGEGDV